MAPREVDVGPDTYLSPIAFSGIGGDFTAFEDASLTA